MIEFKKVLGKEYDPKQAMQILWTSLDVRSREIAVSEKLDEKDDEDLYEHTDRRYKIQFGNVDYKSNAKDDPMGLALLGDGSGEVAKVGVGPSWPSEGEFKTEGAELDAMMGSATYVVEMDISLESALLCPQLFRCLQNVMVVMAVATYALIARLPAQS